MRVGPVLAAASALGSSVSSPRLILTSAGLTTHELRSTFKRMFEAGLTGADEPTVSMLVTAAMAPSSDGAASKRSPGELRRRRWADARKKGRVVEAELTALLGSPVRVDCIDCAQDGTERVEGSLRSASCVWVTGGNTFFLWHHMRMSGAAALIADRVGDGCLYVGQSAGAIVAGYSIETAFWKGWDDPQAASDASWTTETLGAMGLAPRKLFFPHYTPEFEDLVTVEAAKLNAGDKGAAGVEVVRLEDEGATYIAG